MCHHRVAPPTPIRQPQSRSPSGLSIELASHPAELPTTRIPRPSSPLPGTRAGRNALTRSNTRASVGHHSFSIISILVYSSQGLVPHSFLAMSDNVLELRRRRVFTPDEPALFDTIRHASRPRNVLRRCSPEPRYARRRRSSSPGGCPPGPSRNRARRFPPLGSSVVQSHGARAQICTVILGGGNGCALR